MAEVRHNQGEAGGYLVGRRHSNGGIKAVNKSTGQPLEMEGGEVVITRDAVSDSKKRSFNGKMMTNREILSDINQSGGGVAFAEGGEVPDTMQFNSDAEYEYGGKTMCGCDLATEMSKSKSFEEGGNTNPVGLFEDLQILFEYTGYYDSYKGTQKITKTEQGPFQILNKILDNAREIKDKFLTFDLNIKITTSNGSSFLFSIIKEQTYNELILKGGFNYNELMDECVSIIRNDSSIISERVAISFNELTKIYLVGIDGALRGSNDEKIAVDFRQDIDIYDHFSSLTDYARVGNVREKSNFKDWEKGIRSLNKKIKDESGKAMTAMGFTGNFKLANLADGFFSSRLDVFVSTGKPFVTKWEWWKNNVFIKTTSFVKSGYDEEQLKLSFTQFDSTAYEQEMGSIETTSRSKSKQVKAENITRETLEGKNGFSYFGKNNAAISPSKKGLLSTVFFAFSESNLIEVSNNNRYDFYLRINLLYPNALSRSNAEVLVQVFQSKVFFIGKDGIFAFNNRAGDYFRGANFIVTKNEDAKKAGEAAEAAQAVKRKAAREAAREAERAEKQRKEELKNRPYQVRDQIEDELSFSVNLIPSTNPEIIQVERDLNALKKLASLTKGPAKAEMRRAILRKINRLTDRLNNLMIEANSDNQMDREKLITPIGLMTYYYNQARQSPVKRMGEACKLDTPTGVPSKLDIQGYYAVRTAYFKKWFGDWEMAAATGDYSNCSMLVDADTKEPRIMYHGVRRFDPRVQTGAMGQGIRRPFGEFNPPKFPATYFGDSLDYVEFYAGEAENQPKIDPNYQGFIYSVFINMRNPIRIEDLGMRSSYKDLLAYIAIKYGVVIPPQQDLLNSMSQSKKSLKVWNYVRNDINLILTLKKAGYDGIIQYGDVPSFNPDGQPTGSKEEKEYLVFSANQVKSGVVKKSFYLPQFDDVRFKEGGHVRI